MMSVEVTGIAASDPKYADGLAASYSVSGDRSKVYIEPCRVALTDDYGVWIVDFNDLDNGGSGAIVLDMNPYGDISLSNPESVLGYCLLPRTSPLVIAEEIVERLSEIRNIEFDSPSVVVTVSSTDCDGRIDDAVYNLQGMRVSNPRKGELYVVNGRKIIHQ